MQPYDSTKVDTNKMGKMQRNDHTKWTLLQFLRKSVFLKGRVKKIRKTGKKCHLLQGRVKKNGQKMRFLGKNATLKPYKGGHV